VTLAESLFPNRNKNTMDSTGLTGFCDMNGLGWWFFATHLKNMIVKMGSSSPIFGVENKKCLKPPPRYECPVL